MSSPGGRRGPPRPPVPVSVAVRNLFPPLALPDDATNVHQEGDGATQEVRGGAPSRPRRIASLASLVEDRCAAASREVLLRLRLDIVAKTPTHAGDDAGEGERAMYSSEQAYPAAHPRWDHVNERLPRNLDPNCNAFARLVILADEDGEIDAPSGSDKGSAEERMLAEVPLHPSKLRRLPASSDVEAGAEDRSGSGGGGGNGMTIPSSLPPNTILLHYDDGYTRVLPNVYWLLVQKGIVSESVMDPLKRSGSGGYKGGDGDNAPGEDAGGETSVFEEKAFDVLGESPVPVNAASEGNGGEEMKEGKGAGASEEQTQSMYEDDRAFNLLGKPTADDGAQDVERTEQSTVDGADPSASTAPNELAEEAGVDNTKGDEPELVPEASTEEKEEEPSSHIPTSEPLPALPLQSAKNDANATAMDIEELRRLVELERRLLEEEEQQVAHGNDQLRSMMQQVQRLESETVECARAVGTERANLFRSEFRLEAHRLRLLQHLQLIFPIKLVPINIPANPPNYPQHQYTIAGLPLPDDVHNPTVTDDQVSTALGLLCHLVSLTSKYLAVPLRFQVVCKFSRSAILFDRGRGDGGASRAVYPLFRERGVVDREQLDYGLMLLERNVDALLRVRGVEFRPEWNALAKMDKLLVEGEEATFDANAR